MNFYNNIIICLGGVDFKCLFNFPETRKAFISFESTELNPSDCEKRFVFMNDSDWDFYKTLGFSKTAHMEYSLLTAHFSDSMLQYERSIVHGVAVSWRDQAYLICANPGVGKSTQAKWLQELRPGEFSIICGDRPVLEFRHSERSEESAPSVLAHSVHHEERIAAASERTGLAMTEACHSDRNKLESKNPSSVESSKESAPAVAAHSVRQDFAMTGKDEIIVHPSPWNGKENWHGAEAAPLAGVILLERGEENRLVSISEREAMLPMFTYFIQTARTEEIVKKVAELETRLLRAVPFWKLTTHEVPASTRLLLDAVFT